MTVYEDLQRALAEGKFTEEQLLALISTLSNRVEQKNIEKVKVEEKRNRKKYHLDPKTQALLDNCREQKGEAFCCPSCGSISFVKNGTRKGRQRYKCKDCGKTFGDTYGTVFYYSKLTNRKWRKLLYHTLRNDSVRFIHKNTNMAHNTILYNRHRIGELLKMLTSNLDDFLTVAQGDEYYIPLSFKDVKDPNFFITVLGRLPNSHKSYDERMNYVMSAGYSAKVLQQILEEKEELEEELQVYFENPETVKSPGKMAKALNSMEKSNVKRVLQTIGEQQKKKRGISNQQVCILSCVDNLESTYLNPVCIGRLEPRHIEDNLVEHFTEDTILVTDSHSAYKTVAHRKHIPLRQIPSGKHSSQGFNLAKVNGYHSNISRFMDRYIEVASKYLDNYMAWFYWQDKHKKERLGLQIDELLTVMAKPMPKKRTNLHQFKYSPLPFDTKKTMITEKHKEFWESYAQEENT